MGTDSGPFPFGTCSAVRIRPLSVPFQPPTANHGPSVASADLARSLGQVLSLTVSRAYDHVRVAAKRVAPNFNDPPATREDAGGGRDDPPEVDQMIRNAPRLPVTLQLEQEIVQKMRGVILVVLPNPS